MDGEPSTRDISRRTGGVISHTTVHTVLRCQKAPRWGQLELVVEALEGSTDEFRQLWIAVRDSEDVQETAVRRKSATPGANSPDDRRDVTHLPIWGARVALSNEFRRLHSEAGRPTESEIVELAKDVVIDIATVASVLHDRQIKLASLGAHEVTAIALGADEIEVARIRRLWAESMREMVNLERLAANADRKAVDGQEGTPEQQAVFAGADFRPLIIAPTHLRGFDLINMPFHVVQEGYSREEVNEHMLAFGRWVSGGMIGDPPSCPAFSIQGAGYDPAEVSEYFRQLAALQTRSLPARRLWTSM